MVTTRRAAAASAATTMLGGRTTKRSREETNDKFVSPTAKRVFSGPARRTRAQRKLLKEVSRSSTNLSSHTSLCLCLFQLPLIVPCSQPQILPSETSDVEMEEVAEAEAEVEV
jgi:hypothetical protein